MSDLGLHLGWKCGKRGGAAGHALYTDSVVTQAEKQILRRAKGEVV
jgi:hypothetical protein